MLDFFFFTFYSGLSVCVSINLKDLPLQKVKCQSGP